MKQEQLMKLVAKKLGATLTEVRNDWGVLAEQARVFEVLIECEALKLPLVVWTRSFANLGPAQHGTPSNDLWFVAQEFCDIRAIESPDDQVITPALIKDSAGEIIYSR